jgi:hypothetical protein
MIKLLACAMLVMTTLVSPSTGVLNDDEIGVTFRTYDSMPVIQGDDSYTSPAQAWVDPAVIAPGERSIITFTEGFFQPAETVNVTITGRHADDARINARGLDTNTTRLLSRADGSLVAIFIAPTNGSGPYVISFDASRAYVAVITVVAGNESPPGAELTLPKPPAHVPGLPDLTPSTSDGTGAAGHATHPTTGESATPHPSLSEPAAADSADGSDGTPDVPSTSDREGRVDLPGTLPQAPAWPFLGGLPWSIALLGAIAVGAALITAGLSLAARRRR